MMNHLTEDQISRWFIGQSTTSEQRHVQACGACTAELDRFLNTLEAFKSALSVRAERLAQGTSPSLASAPSLFRPIERADDFRHTRWLSLAVHAAVLAVLLLPATLTRTLPSRETLVQLYNRTVPLFLSMPRPDQSTGGGGGGMKTPTPPSKGVLPRGADKQLVPPVAEPRNLIPELIVESTIVAPQLNVRPLDLHFGDPNGVVGPPSAGPGGGGGIGTGDGTGVGPGKGPGTGPGSGGGAGGSNIFNIGGGVSAPVVLSQIQPEYSDDARKARIQGTVELIIVVQADGSVRVDHVERSLGYGLDQKAIEAVNRWKFTPGKRDGLPVATYVGVFVNFSLR